MQFAPLHIWLHSINEPLLISGPCGAESLDQLLKTAKGLNDLNKVSLFRAGVWKPRTRPNAFEGKGEEALKWLAEVKKQFGFKITVEVANAQHTELALKYGIDVLWIGARTTVNPFSVQEIADVIKGVDIPVMIKNPIHADLQLWIGAIERIYNSGTNKIAAIHRGFYYYGKTKYRNKPMWQLPIELKTHYPDLPIICDPSHISGKRELIPFIAQKALDLGMNGLMIESHYDPSIALSDAEQQPTPLQLNELLSKLVLRKQKTGDTIALDKLQQFRNMIDEIDDELINVIKKRTQVIEQIGTYKKEHNITIFQLERWQEILRTRAQWAEKLGLSRLHIERLCQLLHDESIKIQNDVMNE
ncbi:MAG: bifunctional 3-deoxy-7-phosphoheptulonate synthase/chorismate mutase type II [Bacteroidetes bacterium]|nr:bifunctional 3-deoxy-7-phosphoheptulonate synthase/chorismate mutase type II [Bacteroidota bacterium]